ncbi:MAG TPA: hypothetical protein PLN63_09975 [Paludibacteraceae bacterium]|nr:hypothetical protein [Paludibacteraceae bacterium]HOU69542.1 hypothetical protein [Paludibacteraceae bacterium]HPH63927.1 hypothetical protein [Paludibacteraceae bacterium]HQF51233.1 hypothetical protein [Paludibacteraceae bacterium]HQJ89889.1 hypothetical protein [Paludibacteraceae bacterium]
MEDIEKIIMQGSVFKKQAEPKEEQSLGRVKTKAKKSSYTKGSHGSGSAKMKAEYKRRRQNRSKSK